MSRLRFQFWWQDASTPSWAQSAVSLHSHTSHSEEGLDIILQHTDCAVVRTLARWVAGRYAKHNGGATLDWSRAFWTPPLDPAAALAVERDQIAGLQLHPLVSLTDHDNCDAGLRLQGQRGCTDVPISVEWTVPFGRTMFHLGVHNLPRNAARSLMVEMADYTASPQPARLASLLDHLNGLPEALVVLNHPLYDELRLGPAHHGLLLGEFLTRHGGSLHALELNGLRPWPENETVLRMAADLGLPYVSGGDRHGSEPSANLNLTAARSFPEFIEEVRFRRRSHVLFLPQYRRPLARRQARAGCEVAARWTERLHYRLASGAAAPLLPLVSGSGTLNHALGVRGHS
ncbi:MAG: hypothetical protein ACK58M_17070 [Acidobacteriota bacterium]|jgi:hypothetical protein|nr:hypothetical protein [Acidobacteriaceae bacterium]